MVNAALPHITSPSVCSLFAQNELANRGPGPAQLLAGRQREDARIIGAARRPVGVAKERRTPGDRVDVAVEEVVSTDVLGREDGADGQRHFDAVVPRGDAEKAVETVRVGDGGGDFYTGVVEQAHDDAGETSFSRLLDAVRQ